MWGIAKRVQRCPKASDEPHARSLRIIINDPWYKPMTGPDLPPSRNREDASGRWNNHWDHYSLATEANPAQALRRRLIRRLLGADAASQDSAILDVGCGSGDLLAELARHYPEAAFAGIDLSESGIAETARKVPRAKLTAFDFAAAGGAEGNAPEDFLGWASHATCSEVLEHVDDPVSVLIGAARCLKPGGRLVVTVPGGPMSAFDKHLGHRRHYTKAALRDLMERAGLEVETTAAAGFPTFNLYRLVVILRGRRLIGDVNDTPGLLARVVMAAFNGLLKMSLFDSPWGWQIVGRARKPS